MPLVTTTSVIRTIESLFDGSSVTALSDRQLVERFVARRDAVGEAAFAAIVTRHGPMVLTICRQVLGDQNEADDSFQATFLVLARKARTIRDPDLLANWIYGVALRTARKARVKRVRRYRNEKAAMMQHSRSDSCMLSDQSAPAPDQAILAREEAEALYSEVDRLPRPFRLAVVLCYFEGLTLDEAAHRLRCPAGTVRSRLARAYDKLRRGLTRRRCRDAGGGNRCGTRFANRLSGVLIRTMRDDGAGRNELRGRPRRLRGQYRPRRSALAHDVLRSMLFAKLKLTAFALLFLGAVATGAGYVIHPRQCPGKPPGGRASERAAPQSSRTEARPPEIAQDANKPAPGRMFVVGRVLDTQGNPVPNASVLVYARATASPCPRSTGRSRLSDGDRPRQERRHGPNSGRRSAYLIVESRRSSAWLRWRRVWSGLARARYRRRPAGRGHHASPRANHPRPRV